MPRLGLTMTEATITDWLKTDGDHVDKGELLFTFESDKATLEFEAPVSGVLRILVPAGKTVAVMTPVAVLDASPDVASQSPSPATELIHVERLRASPKARAMARREGRALNGVSGTGPRGMIVSVDVQTAPAGNEFLAAPTRISPVARRLAAAAGINLAQVEGSGPRGMIVRADVESHMGAAVRETGVAPAFDASGDLSALTGLRGMIANRLAQGWRERPQVTLTTDADATNLVAAREQAIAELGEKIAYDALLVMLVAHALREFPYINAQLTAEGIQHLDQVNVGVAVDTERGLMVPVVHEADQLDLVVINHRLRSMAERAINGVSQPDDLTGGTFTITNLGMFGIDAFTPIINPPECAILGVGRIVARPIGLNGQIVLRDMLALSLSFDHRLVDGAPAARFLARVKQLIEHPFVLALFK